MRAKLDIHQFYAQHIRPLPRHDKLRLVAVMAAELASGTAPEDRQERSLLQIEGLGAELWQGVDAQAYVHELREEWDHRP